MIIGVVRANRNSALHNGDIFKRMSVIGGIRKYPSRHKSRNVSSGRFVISFSNAV